tara:strand:+ start:1906 stop:2247 length:342 start_codon:yes stop_codon:yes gene_type:complete
MKKLLIFFFFFSLSTEIFSEEYICSHVWNGEIKTTIFKREGNSFIYTYLGNSEYFNILRESEEMLFLFDPPVTSGDDSVFITIINKKNMKYSNNLIGLGVDSGSNEGECVVRN